LVRCFFLFFVFARALFAACIFVELLLFPIKITKNSELKKGIAKALSIKDRLVFVDIYVDPDEHVYPMQVANGSLKDLWLSKGEKT